ncbi:MAG: DegT/DnrJ/EryC1/StrS family aminotransferase [Phycisphaerae bacterium]
MTTPKAERAKFGAAAYTGLKGTLPNPFPRTIGPNAMKYLQEVVDSGFCVDMFGRFEQAFAKAMGVKHCVGTSGCTPALAILAAAFGFEPGDEVIVSPVTDYGTVMGLIKENLVPVFADTAPGTINLSAETIEPCITDRTRAILCVHKTGLVCDMDPINALAQKHGLIVYEDVCQAILSRYKGRIAGTMSRAAGFSFDCEKTMGSDQGGCVITDDDELMEKLRFIGHSRGAVNEPGFGRKHAVAGYAYRMPFCTAAISLAQLEILHENVTQRDKMARLLTGMIQEIPGIIPLPIPDYQNVYSCWMFGFSIDPKAFRCTSDEFAAQLADNIPAVGTGRYYLMPAALPFLTKAALNKTYPFSMPPASRSYSYSADSCPTAKKFLDTFIRWATFCERYLPEHCELAANVIREVAKRNRK